MVSLSLDNEFYLACIDCLRMRWFLVHMGCIPSYDWHISNLSNLPIRAKNFVHIHAKVVQKLPLLVEASSL